MKAARAAVRQNEPGGRNKFSPGRKPWVSVPNEPESLGDGTGFCLMPLPLCRARGARHYPSVSLQLSTKCFIENGGHEGVEFCRRFSLQGLQILHLLLKIVKISDDSALIEKGRDFYLN
jgi:hypothetical protein